MSGMRQKIQYSLALEPVDQGETPVSGYQGTEPFVAKPTSESPAFGCWLRHDGFGPLVTADWGFTLVRRFQGQ